MENKEAERIGQIINLKSQKNTPRQQSKHKCPCGAEIQEIVFGNTVHIPKLCPECDKARDIRHKHREKAVRLRKMLENRIPKRFWQARIRKLSKKLRQKIKELPIDKGLFLFGQPGRGKSFTMCALMRDYLLKGISVKRKSYDEICLEIRQSYDNTDTNEKDIIRKYQEPYILIIEDIGTTVSTGSQESEFSLRTLLVILDHRIEHCKPTHFTSNKSPEEIGSSFDDRVESRLHQACEIIPLTGRDKRR